MGQQRLDRPGDRLARLVLPAREQLGDLLLEQKNPKEALVQYEANLQDSPNRFDGLEGAARAAKLSGNEVLARKFSAALVKLGSHADADSPVLDQAKAYLAAN